jgi:hypothetical protein
MPQDFLRKLEKVLLDPGNVLMGKPIGMHLNWMGVKINRESTPDSRPIELVELEIPGRVKRVVVLVTVARNPP